MPYATDKPHGEFQLVTPRTALRRFTREDRAVFGRLYTDPQVMRHLVDGVPFSARQVAERAERVRAHYRTQGFGMWAVVDRQTHKVIGRAGLQHLSEVEEVEVGYALFAEYWGRGLATEIARALVGYGFERACFPRIVAVVAPANTASIRVLEKCHMRAERTLQLPGGVSLLYAVDRAMWERAKASPGGAQLPASSLG